MGGSITVGIRHTMDGDPKEVVMTRWTNDFFWRFMTPDFLNQGRELREIIDEAKPGNKWPNSEPLEKVERTEYGIVLVDFPSRSVLSFNDYSTPGCEILSSFSSAFEDQLDALAALARAGQIARVFRGWHKDHPKCKDFPVAEFIADYERAQVNRERVQKFQAEWEKRTGKKGAADDPFGDFQKEARKAVEKGKLVLENNTVLAENHDAGLLQFLLSDKVFKIQHKSERYPDPKIVEKWMRERGWRSKLDRKSFKEPR
jgi:hypothetical protein